jgi:hypothetical protein
MASSHALSAPFNIGYGELEERAAIDNGVEYVAVLRKRGDPLVSGFTSQDTNTSHGGLIKSA